MTAGWTAKRFWKAAQVQPVAGGFTVSLDGRPVRTPAKAPLVLPTAALARAVAAEWDAQSDVIDPRTMPMTRSANAALDKVAVQFDEVAALVADYGGSDLLCYRAAAPEALVRRQAAAWDPWLAWAGERYGAPLRVTAGVVHVAQSEDSLARLALAVQAMSAFELTALHDLVALSGSLVLGLAVAEGTLGPEAAWEASRIDETWQSEQWGEDEEAAETAATKRADFLHAQRFWTLCQTGNGPDGD